MNPNDTSRSWHHHSRSHAVELYLADHDGRSGALVGARVAGLPLSIHPVETHAPIDPASLNGAAAAVVEVSADDPRSVARFQALAESSRTPLIAACYEPPLALVRTLVRAGAHDVVPLPLDLAELETSLAPIRDKLDRDSAAGAARAGKLVTVIKSVGGAGATALLSQLAVRYAQKEAAAGREVCLIDLDVQFGDAAFQLGLQPELSLADLIEAGARLDGELLRSTTLTHSSGLKLIAAPAEMLPLESLSSDQLIEIVEIATREFGTLFVDLPANWTNWSLSLLARSDLVLFVTELNVASLYRARRQLDLLESQDLRDLPVRVVVNRYDKGIWKSLRQADVQQALGREVAFTIANDPHLMREAIDRGVPIGEIRRKCPLGRDIDTLAAGIAGAFGLEQ